MIETNALVLKINPYRETSGLVSIFTAELGRITAVLKGLRQVRKRARVEPFCLAHMQLSGRSGLLNLNRYELQQFFNLQGDALAAGFYLFELITRGLGERQVEPAVYRQALVSLSLLEQGFLVAGLRRFEQTLLAQSGYALDYSTELHSNTSIQDDGFYEYVPLAGFASVAASRTDAIPGWVLRQIGAQRYEQPVVASTARKLNQAALKPLIGDKPLISRTLLAGGQPHAAPDAE